MEDQPQAAPREASPTERAYIEMQASLQNVCFRALAREFGGMPALLQNLAGIVAAQKSREVEILALVGMLDEAKVLSRDQWMNRAATIGEKYARGVAKQLADASAPRIAIATSLNGRGPSN
jgi:hypothetical protein